MKLKEYYILDFNYKNGERIIEKIKVVGKPIENVFMAKYFNSDDFYRKWAIYDIETGLSICSAKTQKEVKELYNNIYKNKYIALKKENDEIFIYGKELFKKAKEKVLDEKRKKYYEFGTRR